MRDVLRQINNGNFTRLSLASLGMILLSAAALQWGNSRLNINHALHSESHPTQAAARPATIVRPVSCEKLPNVPGKSITTVVVEFPPNAFSPRHRHPGSVTAFVLKGMVRSQLDNGPAETFTVGQSWFEPPDTIHMFAENASATEPASLLATFVADDDCGPLTFFD
jgi:quercetin dioxygenase-like cupin family protein